MLYKLQIVALIIVITCLFGGCADNQAREQITDTNNRLSQLQDNVASLNVKFAQESAIGTINQLNNLQTQIDQLNGQIATLTANQQNYVTTQKQINDSLQQQLQSINLPPPQESSVANTIASDGIDGQQQGTSLATTNQQNTSLVNEVATKLAKSVADLKNHKLKLAINQLKMIIASSQDDAILEKANYYLALGYFANNQATAGINTGRKFVRAYPKNKNAPDVLLIIYNTQKQLRLNQEAKATKRMLLRSYPDSNAAKHLKSK